MASFRVDSLFFSVSSAFFNSVRSTAKPIPSDSEPAILAATISTKTLSPRRFTNTFSYGLQIPFFMISRTAA